jgi:hypothetical protein
VNAGTWVAVASAVIAAAGAWYSRRQAGQARRSAAAADRQAAAAEQQVAIMRQQLADERADRHQAASPHFTVTSAVIEDNTEGQPIARITVEQDGGAVVSEVRITARSNENVRGLIAHDTDYDLTTITWHDSAPGTTHELTASLEYRRAGAVNVVLDFTSVQAGTRRTWECTLTAVPRRPDPEPRRRGGRVWGYE